jgi:hypothetical protein
MGNDLVVAIILWVAEIVKHARCMERQLIKILGFGM